MDMFDGLYGYEVVLLVLGAVFFVALAIVLLYQIVQGKPYAGLLAFFAVPIAMMGFSGIQKIQFQNGAISIERYTQQLQADPTNAALRNNLQQQVAALASRPTSNPAALTNIAKAQFALGHHAAAAATLGKVVQGGQPPPEARALGQRIQLDRDLVSLTSEVEQHPSDTAAKQKLQAAVTQAASLHIASPVLLAHLANAHAALGDQAKALTLVQTALKIKPELAEAKQLQSRLATRP